MGKGKAEELKVYFRRNGYYRVPDEKRRNALKSKYKKGYEVRFVAMDYEEFISIRRLLKESGYLCGKAYKKGKRRIIPLYGKENYEAFKEWMGKARV